MTVEAPQGIHLVGSTPFASNVEHFTKIGHEIPHHIKSLADGETGPQGNWIVCQFPALANAAKLFNAGVWGFPPREEGAELVPLDEIPGILAGVKVMYDDWAIKSYAEFKKQRDAGVIPKHVKFQVDLPTPLSVMIVFFLSPYRATIEPIWEAALLKALRRIQDNIPHEDLVIQWDIVQEMSLLEGVPYMKNAYNLGEESRAWFEPVEEGVFDRLIRLMSNVDSDVAMGMHTCYGDFMHVHFIEAPSTEKSSLIAHTLNERLDRKLDYYQFQVPKDRDDEAFYEPLKKVFPSFKEDGTYVYVGLVHRNDEEGAKRRIEAAKKALGDSGWGIAAECGIGRDSIDDAMSIINISKSLANPWG